MTPSLRLVASLLAFPLASAPAQIVVMNGPPRPPAISDSVLLSRLTHAMDSLSRADAFSGVVMLANHGTPVFAHAYGMADRERHVPNTVETAFNLGSINKIFTATAIRQLASQGKLDLDSTLGHYWPDYPNVAARQVTIKQLLEHRSGIGGNIFGTPPGGTRANVQRLEQYLPLFVNEPLQFAPGTQQRYSNAGYVVLGLLVQRLSRENYYDYVRTHVWAPAGMTNTAYYEKDSLPAGVALGYTTQDENGDSTALHSNHDLLPGRGSSAGGGYSTAADLIAFVQALKERRVPGGPPAGLGVAGGAPGLNAALEAMLPNGMDLVVLANRDPRAAESVARTVRAWLGDSGD